MSSSAVLSDVRVAPPSTAGRYEFEVFEGRAGLTALRENWQRITATAPAVRFFQLYEWHASYLDSLVTPPARACFFLARRQGAPAGIVPLLRTTRTMAGLPVRSLELPTHAHLPLAGPVARSPEENASIVSGLLQELHRGRHDPWDVVCLSNLLDDGNTRAALLDLGYQPALRVPVAGCDYLRCEPLDRVAARFSKNFRGNLRKARNKLEGLGGVEYLTARQPAELRAALAEFLDVEASGWKGVGGTGSAIKLDPQAGRFYEALVENFGARGACEINLLKTRAGACLAGQLCLVVGDTCAVLKIGYDESYAQVAPGNMLLEHLIRRHSAEGGVRYINLVTDAAWHANWRPLTALVTDVYLFNSTLRGRLAFLLRRTKRRLGRWYRALRDAAAAGK